MKKLNFILDKTAKDIRGSVFFFKTDVKNLNLIETKKGYARGGHYHEYDSNLILVSGLIQYIEKNIETNLEEIRNIEGPSIIHTPAKHAHLLIALEDSIFLESYNLSYSAIDFPEYRDIVKQKMKK
mgnify:CR=1 FL=1|jgi:hypothetical protein